MIMSLVCDVCMENQIEVTSTYDLREPQFSVMGGCAVSVSTGWCIIEFLMLALLFN